MSKTFTLFKNITAAQGSSTHNIYEVPVGRSAIVDITITPTYTSDSSSSGSSNITINISVIIRKQNGTTGIVDNDSFKSSNSLRLERCILESGDTIIISANVIGVDSSNIAVVMGGILQ